MSFFNFMEYETEKINTSHAVIPKYGIRKATEIFTLKEMPDLKNRIKYNGLLQIMLNDIFAHHNSPSMPLIKQIMIHKHDCPVCLKSVPLFRRLAENLQRGLLLYRYDIIELKEARNFFGNIISGYDIYKYYNSFGKDNQRVSGVPFFIQNFSIDLKRINGTDVPIIRTIKKNEDWIVSYVGDLHPFGFLANIFKVKNQYIESSMTF